MGGTVKQHDIRIPLPPFTIRGTVQLPDQPAGLVVLAQGSAHIEPARHTGVVLDALAEARIADARLDLIMPEEGEVAEDTRLLWSDIHLLAGRLAIATDWVVQWPDAFDLPIGYLGVGANAAVALLAAAARPPLVKAIVTCDGRPISSGPLSAAWSRPRCSWWTATTPAVCRSTDTRWRRLAPRRRS